MEEDQTLPVEKTDENTHKTGDGEQKEDEEGDTFIYFKSSSVISILIIVIISLVCILTTSLLIKTALHSHGITRSLSAYFGFLPNRTIDESILTFWQPKSIDDKQPIETITTIINSTSSRPPPPPPSIGKAQKIFRNFILPSLLLSSIFCGILAFCMRLHHDRYPAWGARPKRPKQYVTIELKQAQMHEPV
jgi:hypothetical protein